MGHQCDKRGGRALWRDRLRTAGRRPDHQNARLAGTRSWRAQLLAAVVLVPVLLVGGCSGNGSPPDHPASGMSVGSPSAPAWGAFDPADPASALLDQYDYDGAIALLSARKTPQGIAELAQARRLQAGATAWPDNSAIPHVFYHSLIVDPARAFRPGPKAVGYSQYMVTVKEFTAQLDELHRRGYVLVHPQRIAGMNSGGVMRYLPIVLPPGKKPLVLSQDDVNYYEYMTGDGFATDLFVGPHGVIANHYTDAAGAVNQGSYDLVPIVDDFVRDHPDFSYRGDKGSIAVTGYNGVLGYRSSVRVYGDTAATREAQQQATKVAATMKQEGWTFASHTWGHLNLTKTGLDVLRRDAGLWDGEVRPIVGRTPEIVFPFGADIGGWRPYQMDNPKYRFLHDVEGFDYFFNVDASRDHWMQLSNGSLRQARIDVDGIRMQVDLSGKAGALAPFFDVRSTLDPARPLPVPLPGVAPSGQAPSGQAPSGEALSGQPITPQS